MVLMRYCEECGLRVTEDDLKEGAGIEVDGRVWCREHMNLAPRPSSKGSRRKKKSSNPRRQSSGSNTQRRKTSPLTGSRRAMRAGTTSRVIRKQELSNDVPGRSKISLMIVLGVASLLVLGIIIALFVVMSPHRSDSSSDSSKSPPPPASPAETETPVVNSNPSSNNAKPPVESQPAQRLPLKRPDTIHVLDFEEWTVDPAYPVEMEIRKMKSEHRFEMMRWKTDGENPLAGCYIPPEKFTVNLNEFKRLTVELYADKPGLITFRFRTSLENAPEFEKSERYLKGNAVVFIPLFKVNRVVPLDKIRSIGVYLKPDGEPREIWIKSFVLKK